MVGSKHGPWRGVASAVTRHDRCGGVAVSESADQHSGPAFPDPMTCLQIPNTCEWPTIVARGPSGFRRDAQRRARSRRVGPRGVTPARQWSSGQATSAMDDPTNEQLGTTIGQLRQRIADLEASSAVLDSVLDCIITMDADGKVIEFNAASERTFGYTKAEAIGHTLADLIIPPPLRDAHAAGLARYLATGQGQLLGKLVEMTAMRSDGSEIPVELAITAIRSDRGPIFTGVLRDITERSRAEAAIRQRAQLSALGAAVGLALTSTDSLAGALQQCAEAVVIHMGAALARIWTLGSSLAARDSLINGVFPMRSSRR